MHMPQGTLKARGQPVGVGSLLARCGSQGLNLGRRVWWQACLLTEPSCQPMYVFSCLKARAVFFMYFNCIQLGERNRERA